LRFSELKRSGHEIRDGNQFRAADWRDMAVLLRAPSGKADIFAREFERIGVPLLVERGGFYDSSEVLDLLGLLQMLDNPLQDIPCIAILRSPLVGCSLDELAEIRAAGSGRRFWTALNQARKPASKIQNQTRKKIERFLERFSRWRKSARQSSFSQCLEDVLSETFYDDWLQAQPRGAQRRANVERFLNLTQRFDQFQRQGLFRFLKFIDAQREAEMEPEVAPAAKENTVRLMSIHQSKGLEFPIVAIADLSKRFNEQDFHGDIILDEKYGLCPRVKPPGCGGHYSSLSHWLAQKKQRRELRGEELRLLYVAMTRARDRLILTAGLSKKNWETNWQKSNTRVAPGDILSANSFADWLGLWFASNQVAARNESPLLSWRTVEDPELANKSEPPILPSTVDLSSLTASEKLRDVLNWAYPFGPATRESAKASVTLLRRRLEELNEEAEQKFAVHRRLEFGAPGPKMSATDTGTVTHKFLQHVSLDNVLDSNSLKGEVRRLENENYLTENECSILDLKGVLAFWNSPVGRQILAQSKWVRRELPFTAKFSPEELAAALGSEPPAGLANEFVVIQGVVDLVVALPKEMWILDFKTDGVSESDLPERTKLYEPQLKLYAQALEKIYLRPITNRWLHFLSARRTVKI
jgi:ATP-dependent helicase/nuclease subunit A